MDGQMIKRLQEHAKELNASKNKGEAWFRSRWKCAGILSKSDRFNSPMISDELSFIPDVINRKCKYVIEIDGKYHDLPGEQKKDMERQSEIEGRGYRVFRVTAFDESEFHEVVEQIKQYRPLGSAAKKNFRAIRKSKKPYRYWFSPGILNLRIPVMKSCEGKIETSEGVFTFDFKAKGQEQTGYIKWETVAQR